MASLIIEQRGKREAGTLSGRALIGRWPDNTIVIDDKAVSRIHAWVGIQDGHYYIADAGSRTGTFVNGETLHERRVLHDGDQIRIGRAILIYHSDSSLPTDATEIDLSPRSPGELSGAQGMFMDCVCGAPLWLPREFTGVGQCRYCGHTVTQGMNSAGHPADAERDGADEPGLADAAAPVPAADADDDDDDFEALMDDALSKPQPITRPRPQPPAGRRVPPPAPIPRPNSIGQAVAAMPAPTKAPVPKVTPSVAPKPKPAPPSTVPTAGVRTVKDHMCGICHSPVTVFDEIATCPSCGLDFHADCWTENLGCSAYGCPQVGALAKKA